jgi:DNA-binding transcriptional ArsR family regulator
VFYAGKISERRIAMANATELARIFKVLSVDTRIRIVQLLRRKSLCVTELTGPLGITQAATSQHLRVLKDVGVLWWQKRGYNVYYSLDKRNVARICKAVNGLLNFDSD